MFGIKIWKGHESSGALDLEMDFKYLKKKLWECLAFITFIMLPFDTMHDLALTV